MASKTFSSPLSIAKIAYPLAVAALCGFSIFRGPSVRLSAFALAFSSVGVAAGYTVSNSRGSGRRNQLEAQLRQSGASLESARSEAVELKAKVTEGVNHIQHLTKQIQSLAESRDFITSERDRIKAEMLAQSVQLTNAAAIAAQRLKDSELLAGQLETLEIERMSLIYELYETAVTEADIAESVAALEAQFRNDSAYQVGQKKKAKSKLTKARADFHTQLTEANDRIAELETQLAEKTALAQRMIADIEGEAKGQLKEVSGHLGNQSGVIESLRLQLEESRKTVKALTYRRFDTTGTDNTYGNRLIDALAKYGLTYGAFHHEREGHNGRLKVWLSIIDAPLSRAQDCLDELEAELSLWAKPRVQVSRGMHLFTLATEQEHKVLEAPNVPLSRLENTLENAIHVRIVGGSGSGKSTLLNNLMHYMEASMKGANVTLLDPKAVDDWGKFIPRYWGEECVTGIVTLADSLKGRVSETVKLRKAGKSAPNYSPELFVVDEAQYNYLLAQNADDSYIKERGETAPNYAKKAKGALAGLLSLGRAYNAIGLFVTQLPQVSKVGLNEGSFDPCVNVFLGKQLDKAIESFLPASGFTDSKCKALEKEVATRRQLGQKWIMLVADLPRSKAYLMECPAPGYYQSRFSGDSEGSPVWKNGEENREPVDTVELQARGDAGNAASVGEASQPSPSPSPASKELAAHCPSCGCKSVKLYESKPASNGKYRFSCLNDRCKKKTFRALPLA
jgi:ABC-type multidrug transport system fused ATPase/permease subunit